MAAKHQFATIANAWSEIAEICWGGRNQSGSGHFDDGLAARESCSRHQAWTVCSRLAIIWHWQEVEHSTKACWSLVASDAGMSWIEWLQKLWQNVDRLLPGKDYTLWMQDKLLIFAVRVSDVAKPQTHFHSLALLGFLLLILVLLLCCLARNQMPGKGYQRI